MQAITGITAGSLINQERKVRPYLLFLDTEASGLPKKWNVPYSQEGNWPFIVQVSWIVCTGDGREVKREDHYICNDDFKSSPPAFKIHGITEDFRKKNGEKREAVMAMLAADLHHYEPLLVGHFTELDLHMIGVEFYRTGFENPALNLPSFCTMLATTQFVRNPEVKHLRLGELYTTLFGRRLENQHNSLADAKATADCFFELLKNGDITEETIERQQDSLSKKESGYPGYGIPVLIVFLLTVLIAFLL